MINIELYQIFSIKKCNENLYIKDLLSRYRTPYVTHIGLIFMLWLIKVFCTQRNKPLVIVKLTEILLCFMIDLNQTDSFLIQNQ